MKKTLQTLLFALMAIVLPIGALAQEEQVIEARWGASKDNMTESGTLETALNAAYSSRDVFYIQLQNDIVSEETHMIHNGTLTLDLNGYTWSCSSGTALTIMEGQVIMTDSSVEKTGRVVSTAEVEGIGFSAVRIEHATLTIDGGSYEAVGGPAVHVFKGELFINDGNFKVSKFNSTTVASDYGRVVISGGVFHANNTYYAVTISSLQASCVISGGTFYGGIKANIMIDGDLDLSAHKSPVGISLTSYNSSEVDIKLPEGYGLYDGQENVVTELTNYEKFIIGNTGGTDITLTFNANNDMEETMEPVNITSPTGCFTLPECTFTAPENTVFKAWLVGEAEFQPGDVIYVAADTEVTALWMECMSQIIIKMYDSYGDGWGENAIVVKKDGEDIGTATSEGGEYSIAFFSYDDVAEYAFYWNKGNYSSGCSFEILVKGEPVFVATGAECVNYENGELIFALGVATDDDTTGIEEMKEQGVESKEVYDLTGRRVKSVTGSGIYIVGGKKVVVK